MRILLFFFYSLLFVSPLYSQEDDPDIAQLDSLGMIAYYQKDYPQAVHFFEKMLHLIETKATTSRYLGQIKYVADLYLEVERYEAAERLYVMLLKEEEALEGKQNLFFVQCSGQLAYCYYGMGRYEEAEIYYLDALTIAKVILEIHAPTYASNLNNLGLLYNTMGRYEEAEQLYLEVIDIDRQIDNNPYYQATSLNNLAVLYHEMGRYEEAKTYYLNSQKMRKEVYGVEHPNYALGLNNIARLYADMNRHFEAEEYYKAARKILKPESPYYVYALQASANLYLKQKAYQKAEELWLKALALTEEKLGIHHPAYANGLNDLANLYLETDNLTKALSFAKKGILANAIIPIEELDDWANLGEIEYYSTEVIGNLLVTCVQIGQKIYEKSKDNKDLKEYYAISKLAIHMNERIRNDVSTNQDKLRLLERNSIGLKNGINAAMALKDSTYCLEAFTFAEQNKSILLADVLKRQRARVFGDLPDSLALIELNLQHQKENLEQQQLNVNDPTLKARIATQLNAIHLELDAFAKGVEKKYPRYYALKYAKTTANVNEIQSLLDEQTLLLEYVITDELTYLFVVGKTSFEILPIAVSRNRINLKVNGLRNALSDYGQIADAPEEAYLLYTKSAEWLYQKLVQKALRSKNIENLIVVSDGVLGHVPFEVFLTQTAPQEQTDYRNLAYLIKDYNISYSYSASLWKDNLEENKTSNNHSLNQQLLAFAATYTKPPHRLATFRSKHVGKIRNSLEQLPAATVEVKTLAKKFYGQFLSGKAANEANFKQLASQYRIIHLAMHGVLNKEHPILSSLAFSENYKGEEDNFLQAYEITQLPLTAELVVLSACETGYGQFTEGEGIVSLARSFMYAGVPSLVVSLWQVNDQSTAIIMNLFYQNLAKKMNKAAALRQAKLTYLTLFEGVAAHPALWAAFIQLGDSRSIQLEAKATIYWWMVAFGVLIVVVVGWWIRKKQRGIA